MSQISQILRNKAEEIRLSSPVESAVEHLKQAGYTDSDARLNVSQHVMEKEATNALIEAGVDIEHAVNLVKAAGINLKDLVTYQPEVEDVHPSVELLKQAADYMEALENEISSLKEDLITNSYQEVKLPEQITKAASSGSFTNEDLLELQRMDPKLLTKVANVMEEPWGMGSGVGAQRPKTDPLLEFMLA